MIIWGSRVVMSVLRNGEFNCPNCNDRRVYEHKEAKKFFTLYFIPIFPMETLGTFIECRQCSNQYNEKVLQYAPAPSREEMHQAYRNAVIQAMMASAQIDGPATDGRFLALTHQLENFLGSRLEQEEITKLMPSLGTDSAAAVSVLGRIAENLTDSGKEKIFESVYSITAADGGLSEAARQFVRDIGRALGFSDAHFGGLMAQLQQPAPAGRAVGFSGAEIGGPAGRLEVTPAASAPEGICPNCLAVIPLASAECPTCNALFGPDSQWKILPRGS